MKIQIDRYRLLGVPIGADHQTVLNTLEKRSGKCKYSGFSNETLDKRKKMLADNSNILLETSSRKGYEAEYMKGGEADGVGEHQIEVEKGYELCALLLLLEAGEEQECLNKAEDLYRSQRMSMSYFSSEYREINRIIDYATIGFSKRLILLRHYENAAGVLERRIRNSGVGMGEKELIIEMNSELEELMPFRILDMLSRDDDEKSHQHGILLLRSFVSKRGGLDGNSELQMKTDEFQAFFRQIRSYLTVQEQIELYSEWSEKGSKSACFLHCIALVAQGFAQRKPGRISEALKKIETIRTNELEPLVANMYLLLGQVECALKVFDENADESLKAWSKENTQEELGAICKWCRGWLERDVIKGYKDIDVDPDLESYFADNDVTRYIEEVDFEYLEQGKEGGSTADRKWSERGNKNRSSAASNSNQRVEGIETNGGLAKGTWNTDGTVRTGKRKLVNHLNENLAIFLIITITSSSLLFFSKLNSGDARKSISSHKYGRIEKESSVRKETELAAIEKTLAGWLEVKTKTLYDNKIPEQAQLVATSSLLNQLDQERKENIKKGQKQILEITLFDIQVQKRTPKKAQVLAELDYSDKTIDDSYNVVERTEKHRFQRKYNFLWNGQRWLVDK